MNASTEALPDSRAEWHRRVWRLAGPIIISNLSVPMVGAVDTAVVGHLPDPVFIGAVALGAVIFSFVFWSFGFLRMGTTGFVAQATGAGDAVEVRTSLLRALLLGLALALGLILLQAPIGWLAFVLLDSGERLEELGREYFTIRIWGAPATLANYAILGALIGLQRTGTALVLQLLLNGCNLLLDLLFVIGLGWNVAGVALASVLSESLAALAGLVLLYRLLRPAPGEQRCYPLLDAVRLRALFRVNGDIFIRTLCLSGAYYYFTVQGATLGTLTLAANAVLMHFQHLLAHGLDGFAHATEALAGSAYGARRRAAFRAAVRACTLWALLVALLYSLIYALAGPGLIALLTGIDSVRGEALAYLPWLLVSPLISVWSFQLDGIFIGTTRTTEMRNGMLIALAVFLPLVWLLPPLLGNHGLWLALMLFMVARALTLMVWYPRIERSLE
jgi:multidrug resistance protein, MATE family